MLNIIHCNKSCIAYYSVWYRTTTVHLVIFMWITSCKFSWYFAVNCMISSRVMWAYCHKSHWRSNFSEGRAALPSPFNGGWLHMCSFRKYITHSHPVNFIFLYLCPLFLHTFWHIYIYIYIYICARLQYWQTKVGHRHPKIICHQIVRNTFFVR